MILDVDLPELGLRRGDLGTVVLVHHQGATFEVEFVTLKRSQVRPAETREIAHVRTLEA